MRYYEDVLPSGVPFKVRAFIGEDHEILTSRRNMRDGNTFERFCAAIVISIGDNNNVTEDFINSMLSNDRKFILFTARQFTQKWPEEFEFEYEWPMQDKIREVTTHQVEMGHNNFPVIPYKWVRDLMENIENASDIGDFSKLDKIEDDTDIDTDYKTTFPLIYSSYQDMLDENSLRQQFVLPISEEVIEFSLMTGLVEKKLDMIPKNKITINTELTIRDCKTQKEFKEEIAGKTHTKYIWNHKKADGYDIDALRNYIRDLEGEVQTAMVITNRIGERERIDLVQQTEFFFPSQATSARFSTSLPTRGRR